MKRGGPISNDAPDKKKPAVDGVAARTRSATRARLKLTDFADEILIQVYSFLYFKERYINRRVSQRLLEFVDSSTRGADKLSIKIKTTTTQTPGNMPFVVYMKPDPINPKSSVLVKVDVLVRSWDLDNMSLLQKLISSLPPLRNIRPKAFSLQIDFNWLMPRRFFGALIQRLVEQDVPRSVTEFDLTYGGRRPSRSEIEQAFSAFERSSRNGVQRLQLISDSPDLLLSAGHFTRLFFLSVVHYRYSDAALQGLRSLSGHPTLTELVIRGGTDFVWMTILAAFRSIRKLDVEYRCNLYPGEGEERFDVFGNMIRGTENLECLRTLVDPSVRFWQYLTKNSVASNRLRNLAISFSYSGLTAEKIEEMKQGFQKFAPSLAKLCFRVMEGWSFEEWDERTIFLLSGLRQHPSLKTLELATYRPLQQVTLSTLKQELGDGVKLCVVPFQE